ncbi:MAG: hypothetical protein JRE16_04225 [Deltaproteobacteria bacterium]|jgi:flavin reductase (DIM6/NTAB) family NADH-FMN oxidoreductase RutF|nr:hypothetical protein [Deltaproteobacteria bacterium]
MVSKPTHTRALIEWRPAGLVTWYGTDGCTNAIITAWFALFEGPSPRLRAAWPVGPGVRRRLWAGADFVLNVPGEECLMAVRDLVTRGLVSFEVNSELDQEIICGVRVCAPRLADCILQIECTNSRLIDSEFDSDIVGDVVLFHHHGVQIDPSANGQVQTQNLLSRKTFSSFE